jgi:hypothetical protein
VQAWLGSIGIDLPYLVASFSLVGVAGFISLGMIGPMLWHRCGGREAHARYLPVLTLPLSVFMTRPRPFRYSCSAPSTLTPVFTEISK